MNVNQGLVTVYNRHMARRTHLSRSGFRIPERPNDSDLRLLLGMSREEEQAGGVRFRRKMLDHAFDEMERFQIPDQEQKKWLDRWCPEFGPKLIGGGAARPTYIIYNSAMCTMAAPV